MNLRMSETLLSVRSVTKSFGEITALSEISLNFNRGDVVGLVGGNGAGKTTLLRLLCGLYRPTSGEVVHVTADGKEKPIDTVRERLGVVPEASGLYHRLTAWENIRYHSRLSRVPDLTAWNRTVRIARALDIEDALHRATRGFSRGMRQKTVLIRALAHDPELLLLDEPTAGLDVTSARKVRDLVAMLRDQGRTVIYSTHHLAEAEKVCDRIVVIHNGTLRADGSPKNLMEMTETDTLEDAYIALTPDASREVNDGEEEGWFQRQWLALTTKGLFGKRLRAEQVEEEE